MHWTEKFAIISKLICIKATFFLFILYFLTFSGENPIIFYEYRQKRSQPPCHAPQRRDETAFDRLYSLLKLPLLKFVNGYTGNADASDDIVHNVFLCLYSRPIKNFSNCFGWIFTVARNLALNELNKSRFEVATDTRLVRTGGRSLLSEEELDMRRALSCLDEKERELFALKYEADLTFKTLSAVYGVPDSVLKRRVKKIVEKLKDRLG